MAASHQAVKDFDVRAILKRTSGGDNDTELNELTVAPTRVPSPVIVVTTATPVGKRPRASRKLRSVIVIVPFLLMQALPGQSSRPGPVAGVCTFLSAAHCGARSFTRLFARVFTWLPAANQVAAMQQVAILVNPPDS